KGMVQPKTKLTVRSDEGLSAELDGIGVPQPGSVDIESPNAPDFGSGADETESRSPTAEMQSSTHPQSESRAHESSETSEVLPKKVQLVLRMKQQQEEPVDLTEPRIYKRGKWQHAIRWVAFVVILFVDVMLVAAITISVMHTYKALSPAVLYHK